MACVGHRKQSAEFTQSQAPSNPTSAIPIAAWSKAPWKAAFHPIGILDEELLLVA
jgi:hypothetical protein